MKQYPLVGDLREPAFLVAMPRAPRPAATLGCLTSVITEGSVVP
jgi:hypothetical protein